MTRKNILILGCISAFSIIIYLLFSLQIGGIGFPLDDAWIHQTYARNLAAGEGWSFVAGQPSAGLTAPLWGLLLAFGSWLGLGPYIFTFILGWLVLWALSVTGSTIFISLAPDKEKWAITAGVLLATEWHLVWAAVSGMETLLYALIVLIVLVRLLNNKKENNKDSGMIFLGALVGISGWIRPEGITLFGPILLVIFMDQIQWQKRIKEALLFFTGFGLFFIPYLFFNRWLAGDWWPNTFYAKQAEYALLKQIPLWSRLFEQFSLPMVGVGILLLPGFVYMLVHALREKQWVVLAAAAWTVGHFTLYAIRLPVTYQHGRYGIPAMPVYFLIALVGIALWFQPQSKTILSRIFVKTWMISIPVTTMLFFFVGGNTFGCDVAFINSEMVDVANWVSENIPQEELLASHDIGALGYFSDHQILDLAGLISPEVIPIMRDEKELALFLDRNEVNYLITFPSWYPSLSSQGSMVYQTDAEISPLLGGENMAVYCWNCPEEIQSND